MDDIAVLRQGSHVVFARPGKGDLTIVDESRLSRPMGHTIFRLMLYMGVPYCDEATQFHGSSAVHIGTFCCFVLIVVWGKDGIHLLTLPPIFVTILQ